MVEADIIQKKIHAVIIGDEILSGKREDKHLAYLIKTLRGYGLNISRADYIPDDPDTIKKTIESIIAQILISPLLNNGNIEITTKTIKNTIPKLLFELFFISNFLSLIIFPLVTLCETIKIVQSIHS